MWNCFNVAFLLRTSGLVLLATLSVGCSFGHQRQLTGGVL
jgi:hypothetical protein